MRDMITSAFNVHALSSDFDRRWSAVTCCVGVATPVCQLQRRWAWHDDWLARVGIRSARVIPWNGFLWSDDVEFDHRIHRDNQCLWHWLCVSLFMATVC